MRRQNNIHQGSKRRIEIMLNKYDNPVNHLFTNIPKDSFHTIARLQTQKHPTNKKKNKKNNRITLEFKRKKEYLATSTERVMVIQLYFPSFTFFVGHCFLFVNCLDRTHSSMSH